MEMSTECRVALNEGSWERSFRCKYLAFLEIPLISPKLALLCQFEVQNVIFL